MTKFVATTFVDDEWFRDLICDQLKAWMGV